MVIGGDGTLLRSFKHFIFRSEIYVIAINAGSLGFLTEIKKEKVFEEYDNFLAGSFKYEKRYILEIRINQKKYYALNEIVISKGGITSKVLRVKFSSDNEYMCTYKGDGVIISTPTGSTAYSMSAGGPIVKSNMKAMIITPLAPHNLNTRPIVISGEEKLQIQMEDTDRTGQIVVDGQVNTKVNSESIIDIEYSNMTLNLVIPKDRNYYSVLREKLKWGDNLC
ncbi:NAD(+)/NADH kinase [Fusobacterium ulcerans]|uniref:NAD(+)/NADH kinase n=1 Tax=Fusobacterium ulcerans TaxID=861 RepID=UPI001FCC5996|nr:NAD(+)/NADH kinase [Fusobacterium ulcerans]